MINDASDAMSQLSLTMANMSFMRLDQLGLGAAEVKQRMEELQSAFAGMSKEAAFQEAVLGIAEEKYGSLADTMAETISGAQQMSTAWQQLRQDLAASIVGEVADETVSLGANQLSRFSEVLQRIDGQKDIIRSLNAAIEAGVPGAQRMRDMLDELSAKVMTGAANMDDMNAALTMAEEWLGRSAYAAGATATALDTVAISAANAASSVAMLAGVDMAGASYRAAVFANQVSSAGGMGPVERPTSSVFHESNEWNPVAFGESVSDALVEGQRTRNIAIVRAAQEEWSGAASSVADDWSAELKSAIQGVEGLFDTSDVTQEDLDAASRGEYLEKADEYLRQLRDEVRNGVDYEGVDIMDAARRAGIDPSLSPESILKQFEQAWDDSSLFAGGANLDLINEEAVKREVDRAKKSASGEAAIMDYFTALYGPEAAQAAVGKAGGSSGGGGKPLAGTSASGALAINNLTLGPDALAQLQESISSSGIEIKIAAPSDMMGGFLLGFAQQLEGATGSANNIGESIGHHVGVAIDDGIPASAMRDFLLAFAGQFADVMPATGTIGESIGYHVGSSLTEGMPDTAMRDFLLAFASQLGAENADGGSMLGTLGNIGQSMGGAIVAGMAEGVAPETAALFVEALSVGDRRVFLIAASGLAFAPKPGDVVIFSGELWEIGSGGGTGGVQELNPAGVPVMYTVGCVRSGRQSDDGREVLYG